MLVKINARRDSHVKSIRDFERKKIMAVLNNFNPSTNQIYPPMEALSFVDRSLPVTQVYTSYFFQYMKLSLMKYPQEVDLVLKFVKLFYKIAEPQILTELSTFLIESRPIFQFKKTCIEQVILELAQIHPCIRVRLAVQFTQYFPFTQFEQIQKYKNDPLYKQLLIKTIFIKPRKQVCHLKIYQRLQNHFKQIFQQMELDEDQLRKLLINMGAAFRFLDKQHRSTYFNRLNLKKLIMKLIKNKDYPISLALSFLQNFYFENDPEIDFPLEEVLDDMLDCLQQIRQSLEVTDIIVFLDFLSYQQPNSPYFKKNFIRLYESYKFSVLSELALEIHCTFVLNLLHLHIQLDKLDPLPIFQLLQFIKELNSINLTSAHKPKDQRSLSTGSDLPQSIRAQIEDKASP